MNWRGVVYRERMKYEVNLNNGSGITRQMERITAERLGAISKAHEIDR